MTFIFLRKMPILYKQAILPTWKLKPNVAQELQITKLSTSGITLAKLLRLFFVGKFTRMTWDMTMCKCPHPEDQFLSQGRQHLLLELRCFWHLSGIGLSGHLYHSLSFQQEKSEVVFTVTIHKCLNMHIHTKIQAYFKTHLKYQKAAKHIYNIFHRKW